jgi:hypothetical protein
MTLEESIQSIQASEMRQYEQPLEDAWRWR